MRLPFYSLLSALRRLHPASRVEEDVASSRGSRGAWGEEQALRWLQREHGMRLIARNWRDGRCEIDLVMMQGDLLVFVEVRTRRHGARFNPIETVNRRKRRAQRRACLAFMRSRRLFIQSWRFDVVGIRYSDGDRIDVEYFPNVRLTRG